MSVERLAGVLAQWSQRPPLTALRLESKNSCFARIAIEANDQLTCPASDEHAAGTRRSPRRERCDAACSEMDGIRAGRNAAGIDRRQARKCAEAHAAEVGVEAFGAAKLRVDPVAN